MKIALPVNEDRKTICISFGRTSEYMVLDTETNKKEFHTNEAAQAAGGAGIKAAQFLADLKVDIVLTPRCGENAAKVLEAAGVTMFKTDSDDIEEQIGKWKENKLSQLSEIHPGFHNHGN